MEGMALKVIKITYMGMVTHGDNSDAQRDVGVLWI